MAWRTYLGLIVVAAVVSATISDPARARSFGVAIGIGSVVAVAAGAYWHRLERSISWHVGRRDSWGCFALGLAILVGADAFRTSWGPLAAFAAYPFFMLGLALLVRGRSPGVTIDSVVVACIGGVAVAFSAWALWVGPQVHSHRMSWPDGLAAVLLPMGDIALLILSSRLKHLSESYPPSHGLVTVAVAALLAVHGTVLARVANGSALSFQALDPLLVFAFGIWGVAALHPSMRTLFEPVVNAPSRLHAGHVSLMAGAALLGPLLMVADRTHPSDMRTIALGSAVLSGLVVAHLVRLVQERAHVEHAAQHDELTGLPRGELFHARLAVSLAHAQQRQSLLCVMFIDLDRFKKINDSLGHAAGNQLLQLVAKRLRRCIREDDTVARNGGDEFTVLLPHLSDPADAEVVAEKILQAFVEPFAIGKKKVFSSPSVGVALYPRDGNDPETLLKNADAAMYRAKERGRNNYKLYTPDLNASAHEALDLESDLHLAMERNELVLNYQPRVDLRTGRIVGVEALVRWHHPKLGLLSPDRFIPVAEETGLIVPLGEWVMETACQQAVVWWETGYPPIQVAVNLSARQFQHGPVSDMVASVLRRTGLKPELLELEITESLALQGGDRALAMLHDLKRIGVQCSIDDFGVGYSNFSYLGTLPIDTIKIDKSFMDNLRGGVGGSAVVIGLVALAHSLEMKVVAEGVETIDQLNFLKSNGCDQMQGFLFSKAISAEQMESLLMLELVAPGPGRLGDDEVASAPAYDADHGRGVQRAGDRGEVAEAVG